MCMHIACTLFCVAQIKSVHIQPLVSLDFVFWNASSHLCFQSSDVVLFLVVFFSFAVLEKYSDDAVSYDGSAVALHSLPDFPHEFHVTFVQLLCVPSDPKCLAGCVVST